ncbi:MAG: hypothetical protein GSR78_03725, partial [Desulfurococcales archaeon]|nr:hypothetical protein [Desulfurococcales archaeon]
MRRISAGVLATLILVILLSNALTPVAGAQWSQEVIGECTLRVAAVSSSGGGVLGNLTVRVTEGTGRVYISTSPATEIDTQGAALIAAFTASMLLGVDPARYDFYYTLESPSIIVGGPSAGAAMAVATIAALSGAGCDTRNVITGMVYPDGTIGPVGGLKEKLQAVAEGGGRLFIVPRGQLVYTSYERVVEHIGPLAVVRTVPVKVNLTEEGARLGVEVREAGSVVEAARLLLGININLTRTGERPTLEGMDNVYKALKAEYERLNSTAPTGDPYRDYLDAAMQYYREAESQAGVGKYFIASRLMVEALAQLQTAIWLDETLASGLNVTSQVEETIKTLNSTTSTLADTTSEAGGLGYLYAWLAAADVRTAEESLDNGLLPTTLTLTGRAVDTRPLETLAHGYWLARFSGYLAELDWPSVSPDARERFLAISLARSINAYATTLASEAGVDLGEAERVAVEMAVSAGSSNDTLAAVYLGLASAALASSLIHSAFDGNVLVGDAEAIAGYLAGVSQSRAASAMLEAYEYYSSKEDTRLAWAYLDLAILYSWSLIQDREQSPATVQESQAPVQAPGAPDNGATPTPGNASGTGEQGPVGVEAAVIIVGLLVGFGIGAVLG